MKHLVLVDRHRRGQRLARRSPTSSLSAVLYLPRRMPWPSRATLRIHVARGVVVTVMAGLFFWGIGRVPLAQAIALTFIAPLIALLLAACVPRRTDRPAVDRRLGRRVRRRHRHRRSARRERSSGRSTARQRRDPRLGALLRGQHRDDAPSGARRQAARDQLLPVADGHGPVARSRCRSSACPHWPGEQWLWIVVAALLSTSGTLLFAWAYARGPGELSRGHRI